MSPVNHVLRWRPETQWSDRKTSPTDRWKTRCRCGEPLAYSIEDLVTGQPAEGADFWCMVQDPEKGPHDWGVVVYR